MRRTASALVVLAFLAGCSTYALVPPARTSVVGGMSVEPGTAWNRASRTDGEGSIFSGTIPLETWTIDGLNLEAVTFFGGIAEGQPLFRADGNDPLPPFHSTMTAPEIVDLFESALSKYSKTALATGAVNLRPVQIAGIDGFRFEVSYALKDDVDRQMAAAGCVKDGKLYLITFQGTRLYHYGRYLPEFERILASLRLVKT